MKGLLRTLGFSFMVAKLILYGKRSELLRNC